MSKVTHFQKYHELCRQMGIGLSKPDEFMGKSREYWLKLYNEDEHLNNHPMAHFDSYFPWHLSACRRHGVSSWSPSDTVCCLKHVIKHELLGKTPKKED